MNYITKIKTTLTIIVVLVDLVLLFFCYQTYKRLTKQETEIFLDPVIPIETIAYEEVILEVPLSFGKASWYDYDLKNNPGWSKTHRTAAVRDWPRGTMLEVCNTDNNKCIEVLVNDYGPNKTLHPDRIIDLSSFAFSKIANLNSGIINVTVKPL